MAKQQEHSPGLMITRIFDAPPEKVWKAWTDPEQVKKWWGPKIFTSPICKIDLRVGGKYLFSMQWPDGKMNYSAGVYSEIVPYKKLVGTMNFADEKGNTVPPSTYGLPGVWPDKMILSVTLEEQGGKTKMTVFQTGHPAGKMTEMATQGWNESLDKLAASLKKMK